MAPISVKKGELKIALMGTGGPIANPKRISATGIGIVTYNDFLLFDCGPGVWRNADLANVPMEKLSTVFLSHYHSDHIGDLGEAHFGSWVQGRKGKLPVWGPKGIEKIVEGFNMAYELDNEYRFAHHGKEVLDPEDAGMIPHEIEVGEEKEEQTIYDQNGLKVIAFPGSHPPISPVVGYKILYGGKKIVFSGDTIVTDWLEAQIEDCDVFLSEVLSHDITRTISEVNEETGRHRFAKITRDILDYHMDPKQVAQIANAANVKKLVLIHITPPILNPLVKRFYLRGVKKIFHNELILGEDRMIIDA